MADRPVDPKPSENTVNGGSPRRSFAAVCDEEGGFDAWHNELLRWVRWYRVPAFKLTFIFQLVTLQQQSVYHFAACELYSDAQTIMADDLALNSLETGYFAYMRNAAALGEPFAWVGEHYRHKLRYYYDFYRALSKPFDYMAVNPPGALAFQMAALGCCKPRRRRIGKRPLRQRGDPH
jgi:hypothetical protein